MYKITNFAVFEEVQAENQNQISEESKQIEGSQKENQSDNRKDIKDDQIQGKIQKKYLNRNIVYTLVK